MKLIFKYLKKYKGLFLLNIVAIFLVASAELGLPFIISRIIDEGIAKKEMDVVYQFVIWLVSVAILGAIGNIVLNYCASRTAAYIMKDLRNDIFAKVQTFSPNEIQDIGISSIITRTTTDVFQILNFVSTFYRSAVLAPIMLILTVILIIIRAPQLALSTIFVVPIVVIGLFIIIKVTKKLSERQQKNLDQLNLVTRENLTGVRVIRAFRKGPYEQERFSKVNDSYTNTSIKLFRIMVSIEPVFYFLLNVSILILMWFGAKYIEAQTISLGQLVEFLDYQFHVMFSILTFSLLFMMFPRTMVSSRRIKELLEKEPVIKNIENPITEIEPIHEVSFNNVTFKYPDADEPVLKNINLKAKKGEVIAFVGSTGSGKSTLINLIPRLYDVTEGNISFNGEDIKNLDLNLLRSKIGFILQKALLFNGTIASNILFGKEDATEEEMIEAAKIAQSYEFIQSKEKGLEDRVSELGSNLSGGQKQRLSITRAVVKKPDVYIFDDSFSALDYKTDFELRKALFSKTKESIVFIVAQRLSSIVAADKIVVLHHGQVVAIGKHEELIKNCQIYQEIALSQNLIEEVMI
ncbi:ABC transporter, permease/ATP-binding protein [Alteracholeplasma palmae J233]|uniref:ABC transporter, permease/ATP-binding protein n=1 Tax=Alteracholeplasma palmae (strain ATCC 49389 / J233) TaxID=1318466 RepID=U4KK79_ALTPJ|nr:ABC transporter ATP-binding protein [Alteracholeplasma palmae]CCV63947.1 ABC transporter, permease/ATP-binding protein [Alteracholeplasma palmae J233]